MFTQARAIFPTQTKQRSRQLPRRSIIFNSNTRLENRISEFRFVPHIRFPKKLLAKKTELPFFPPFLIYFDMARICAITGKRPTTGSIIHRKGQSKKSGGIGTHVTKTTKRKFRPNLQRIKVRLPSGQVKRLWVCVKAIKAGLVEKA
jgi:large subunit ribosomal protein L28